MPGYGMPVIIEQIIEHPDPVPTSKELSHKHGTNVTGTANAQNMPWLVRGTRTICHN